MNIEGRTVGISSGTVIAGTAINRAIFTDVYEMIRKDVKPPDDDEITLISANLSGYRTQIFTDQLAFDAIVRELTEQYKSPIKNSVMYIRKFLTAAVEESAKNVFGNYPKLKQLTLKKINLNIDNNEETTIVHLMTHVDAHKAFINSKHPHFSQYV